MPDDQLDLTREIAFNLSLIYQASGNVEMARQLINTHCVVWKYAQIHHLHQQFWVWDSDSAPAINALQKYGGLKMMNLYISRCVSKIEINKSNLIIK